HVHDHQVRLEFGGQIHGALAVGGFPRHLVADLAQHLDQVEADQRLVLGDEHTQYPVRRVTAVRLRGVIRHVVSAPSALSCPDKPHRAAPPPAAAHPTTAVPPASRRRSYDRPPPSTLRDARVGLVPPPARRLYARPRSPIGRGNGFKTRPVSVRVRPGAPPPAGTGSAGRAPGTHASGPSRRAGTRSFLTPTSPRAVGGDS